MSIDASNVLPVILPASPCEVSRWFDEEVRPHEHALRAYLRGRFPSLPDLDDVVQETYIRLIRARESDHIRSPKSLLFVTARNVAIDVFRRRNASPTEDLADLEHFSVLEEGPNTTDSHVREQKLQLLEEAIKSLPERCRQVIMLKKIEGLSYDEISRKLGISHNTISAHLTVGVTKCRDYLQAHGVIRGRES
jgi:RNA polymerase sigma-70 factor (ECF subfamily)